MPGLEFGAWLENERTLQEEALAFDGYKKPITKESILLLLEETVDALERIEAGTLFYKELPVAFDLSTWGYVREASKVCYVCAAGARHLRKTGTLLTEGNQANIDFESRLIERIVMNLRVRAKIRLQFNLEFPNPYEPLKYKPVSATKDWLCAILQANRQAEF